MGAEHSVDGPVSGGTHASQIILVAQPVEAVCLCRTLHQISRYRAIGSMMISFSNFPENDCSTPESASTIRMTASFM